MLEGSRTGGIIHSARTVGGGAGWPVSASQGVGGHDGAARVAFVTTDVCGA